MVDKNQVISVLRALLVSNGKNGIPLRELKQDYYFHGGNQEIPTFGHKSVFDFLTSSGEFILNADSNGLVMVREKPKIESLHIKKLVTEQKCSAKPKSRSTSMKVVNNMVREKEKVNRPHNKSFMPPQKSSATYTSRSTATMNSNYTTRSPEHMSKPSTVFTFNELNENKSLKSSVLKTQQQQPAKKHSEKNLSSMQTSDQTLRNEKQLAGNRPKESAAFQVIIKFSNCEVDNYESLSNSRLSF